MPYMSDTELVKSIRANKILPCYLFWGRDAFTCEGITKKLIDKLVPEEARDTTASFPPQGFPCPSLQISAKLCRCLPTG